jgi:hypothetical protein
MLQENDSMHKVFSALLAAGLVGLALSSPNAQADTILVFGQNGLGNNFTATNNGSGGIEGGTTLSANNIQVTISGIDAALTTPITAYFDLSAKSSTAAYVDTSGHINQDFNGHFSITSGLNDTGINYLSGAFQTTGSGDGATILGAGSSLTLSASSPDGITSFTSDVIGVLGVPRAISLAFTNVTPSATLIGSTGPPNDQTLAAFTSNVSGTFSAVPEPASAIMLGIGISIAGLVGLRRRKKLLA